MKETSLKRIAVGTPNTSVQLLWSLHKVRAKEITLRAILDLKWGIHFWQLARPLCVEISAEEFQISWNLPETSRC